MNNIFVKGAQQKVHIVIVWTIIMQSLIIKEWKLLQLQITRNMHPLSILDEKSV